MQIHLQLSADGLRLPIAYQYMVQGMIYHALDASPADQRFLHERGYADDGKQFKCFIFSRLDGPFRIEARQICFDSGCSLEIRSCDPYMIQLLLAALAEGTVQRLGSNQVTVASCRLDDRHVRADNVDVVMRSPVTVYQTDEAGHTDYAAPDEPRFHMLLQANAAQKWESLMPTPTPGLLTVEPLSVRPRDKVVTTYKGTYITAWLGAYRLTGPQTLLDLLYQIGLGAKNSQGFGMFEVVQ